MVDIAQQIAHWRDGAREEWQVSGELLEKGRVRHALFFAHLALEKALKAHVCRHTADLAPRTHNLVRLADAAELDVPPTILEVLGEMNEFVLTGRYPDATSKVPALGEARILRQRAEEAFAWLMQQL
jgi:HEPN domain-containing protein